MNAIVAILTSLTRGLAILAGLATFLVMLLICADVTLRYFGSGVPGTLDIVTYYLMLIVAFLSLARVEQMDGMISVDGLYEVAPSGGRRWIMTFACLTTTLVCGGIAYASLLEAIQQFNKGAYVVTLSYVLPTWPAYFIVPVAFAMASITAFLRAMIALAGRAANMPEIAAKMGLTTLSGKDKDAVSEDGWAL